MSEQLAEPGARLHAASTATTAVVLSWNDAELVADCLVRIGRARPRPEHVVVVDNASASDASHTYRSALPSVEILRLPRNLGFAGAVNLAVLRAAAVGARWVWLVNSDVELTSDALGRLLAAASRHRRAGLVAPVLVDRKGRVQAWGGGSADLWTGMSRHAQAPDDRIDYLSGACLLISMEMLAAIGGLDERFFFYWEDVDLGFRARAAGWELVVAEDCRLVHYEGTSLGPWSASRWFRLFEGLAMFLRLRAPIPALALSIRLLHHSVAMIRHRRWPALRGAWRGAASGWKASL